MPFIYKLIKSMMSIDRVGMKSINDDIETTYATTSIRGIGDRLVDKKVKLAEMLSPPYERPRDLEIVANDIVRHGILRDERRVVIRKRKWWRR